MTISPTESGKTPHQRANEKFKSLESSTPETLSPKKTKLLIHELRVHQIELEMQNEEMRRTQHELEASRSSYFELYDLAPVGYLTLNDLGLICKANLAAATMLGLERKKLLKKPITNYILPEDQDIYHLGIKELVSSEKPMTCELRLMKKDRAALWVQLSVVAVLNHETGAKLNADGASLFLVTFSNITEHKRSEEAHARLADLVDSSDDAIIAKNLDGTIFSWNSGSECLFGYRAEEVIGKPITLLIPPELQDEEKQILKRLSNGEQIESFETVRLAKDGRRVEVSVTSSPIIDSHGRIIGASKIARDITKGKLAEEALRRAKEEWERTFASVPDLIAILDNQHRVLQVNEAMAKRLGLKPEECIGLRCYEVVHGTSGPPEFCPHSRTIEDGCEHIEELSVDRFGGDFQVTTTPLLDEMGERIGSVHIAHDVTERKQMEDALRKSEEKFRTFFEQSLDAVFLGTVEGGIIEANPAACEMFGMTRQELCQVGRAGIIDLNDARLATALEERKRTSQTITEMTCIRKNGERFPAEISSIIMPGHTQRASIIIRDITERKQAEDDLRASEEQFRAIFELSSIGMAMADPMTGRFLLVNDHFCKITGYSRDDMIQKTFSDITHPEDLTRDNKIYEAAKNHKSPTWIIEKRYIRKDSSVVWVEVSGTMLYDLDGKLKYSIAAISDITGRKQVDEALKMFNEELESRVKERTDELRDKDKMLLLQSRQAAMGEMIGNIAHQWRQPLNTLGLFTQRFGFFYGTPSFNKEFVDTSVAKSMEIIHYMSHTIDDFRNFFSPERDKSTFSVYGAVSRVLTLVEASFADQKIKIEKDEREFVTIYGYPNEYAQVLIVILINARDAISERNIEFPQIKITIGAENGRSVVTIADNAGGISKDIIGKIFDPYFTTKGPQQGTGVGLYMSKAIIENNMGGRISARNTKAGAEFRIEV